MKEGLSMKKRNKIVEDTILTFDNEAEDKGYKRYKQIQYGYLVLKALLSFLLGLLVMFLLKLR